MNKWEEEIEANTNPTPWHEPIVTSHPYFMENAVKTFLDEDTAVNVNNSEDPAPEE